MQIHTTDSPAKMAGEHISKSITDHTGDVLCLLSGGSALDVIEYIKIGSNKDCDCCTEDHSESCKCEKCECRTIFIMGDERESREPTINNYLQLATRYGDHNILKHLVETVPSENEPILEFAKRIEKKLIKLIAQANNLKIISLMGIGPDGHTAGIFPMNKTSFEALYKEDGTYVPVYLQSLKIDSRASITPTWVKEHVDEVIGYATGNSKQKILELLINESKEIHERPSELLKLIPNSHLYTDQVLNE